MNHSLNHLDDCIFDYLALNADRPIPLAKIFEDIRSGSGHRCNELTDSSNHRRYFLSTCYSLDRNYTNIKKIHRNNRLYLVFQKAKNDTNFDPSAYNDALGETGYWRDEYNLRNIVDYMCDNSMLNDFDDNYYSNKFDDSDTLLHLLVRYNRYDELENVLRNHNVDLNKKNAQGETPLELAITMKNKKMIKLLINYWEDGTVKQLRRINNQNKEVFAPVKNEAVYVTYWRYFTYFVLLTGFWHIISNVLHAYHYVTH